MKALNTFNFHGTELFVPLNKQGERCVAIRPICDALGIASYVQRHKIQNNPAFRWDLMVSPDVRGREQEHLCILLEQLPGWLFSINANKVKPEAREALLVYQNECFSVLYQHFMPNGVVDLSPLVERLTGVLDQQLTRLTGVEATINDMSQRLNRHQDEIDALREVIQLILTETEEREIRALMQVAKQQTGMDGRTIAGNVRSLLGTSGIYNTANANQVKNALRNILGKGVFGPVEE